MSYKPDIMIYKPCIKCKIILTNLSEDYCGDCKYKSTSKKSTANIKYKIFMTRFDSKSNKNIKFILDKYSDSELGKIVNISNNKIQRNLTFIDSINAQKTKDFSFCLEFNNIDDLSNFILNSKQVNLGYLSHIGAKKLQSVPKIQKLLENHEELSSYKVYYLKSSSPPYTSPLQLLTKSSFWEHLLKVFFQNIYAKVPIFSIAYFDPMTAPRFLMAAIYYTGYKFLSDQPEELTMYMDNYAKENLKYLVKQCSLSAIQSLLLYFSVYYQEGNVSLHYTCRSHATRIGYAIGIHLDNKTFSELEKYTRRLVLIRLRCINIIGSSSHNFTASFLTEFGSLDIKPIEPEWQVPSKNSVIYYEDENEGLVHSVCYTHYINFFDELKYCVCNSSYNNVRDSRYKSEWNKTRKDVTRVYQKYTRIYRSLNSMYPKYIQITSRYEFQVCIFYHDAIIDMYSNLVNKIEDLSSSDIDEAVHHLDWVFNFILSNNQSRILAQTQIILLGYQYLSIYKLCSPSTKQAIQDKLVQIIQIITDYYTPSNALSFIILKNGYKSIVSNNIR